MVIWKLSLKHNGAILRYYLDLYLTLRDIVLPLSFNPHTCHQSSETKVKIHNFLGYGY